MITKRTVMMLMCVGMLLAVRGWAAESCNLVRIQGLAEQDIGEAVVTEIFENIDVPVQIKAYPGKRCSHLVESGQADGEMMRIYNYGEVHNELHRVSTPYYALETTVFCKKGADVHVSSKEDLAKYKIVVVRGVQHTADAVEGLPNVHIVNGTEQMMRMLDAGRADIALANRIDGQAALEDCQLDTIEVGPSVAHLDLYMYLNSNKEELVPLLNEEILRMKDSGELEQAVSDAEAKYLSQKK